MAVADALFDNTRPMDCPAEGFITYTNRRVLGRNQFLTLTRADGIDNCYRECILRSECGFFEITVFGFCIMFTGEFEEGNIIPSLTFTLGVPCEGEKNSEDLGDVHAPTEGSTGCLTDACTEAFTGTPTDAPTEASTGAPTNAPIEASTGAPTNARTEASTGAPTDAPTEASTGAPTDAPTEASAGAPTRTPMLAPIGVSATPNDCPAEGYITLPRSSALRSGPILDFLEISGQGVDLGDFCNAACSSRSDCGFFHVVTNFNTCVMFRGTFDEFLVESDSNVFVGLPCCPVQGYVIYSANPLRSLDVILEIADLEQEEGDENCNAECSLRRECGYFHVTENKCVMFRGQFNETLVSSDAEPFVGVPCSN